MAQRLILLSRLWRHLAAVARIVLAAGLVARLGVEFGSNTASSAAIAFAAFYLLFSSAFGVVDKWHREGGRRIAFSLDCIAFIVAALMTPSAWQVQLQYAFVLITVLLFHEWPFLAVAFALVAVAPGQLFPAMAALMLLASLAMLLRAVLQDRLFQSSRQAVFHRAEAIHARAAERARLVNDFHDGPLQVFTGLQVRLGALKRMIERGMSEQAIAEVGALQELWQAQVLQVRSFVTQVRSDDEGTFDTEAAVRRLAAEFGKQTGIRVDLKVEGLDGGSRESMLGLVMMLGEALHNVRKHAGASKVRLTLSAGVDAVCAVIEDNGTGFPFGGTYTLDDLELMGMGPVSIRRRVREVGGDLSVESRPGRGSTLRIQVPL